MRMFGEDYFEVDESGLTKEGFRCLDPAAKKAMYTMNSIIMVVMAVFAFAALKALEYLAYPRTDIVLWCLLGCYVICIAYLLVSPEVFFRRYRYRVDGEKLEIRKGVIVITHVLVPVERIHQVAVSRGPINRRYGLADVTVTTAGGVVTLQYLQEEVAESIAEDLNQVVIGILGQRNERGSDILQEPSRGRRQRDR
jgi:hypothetical protein